MRRYDELVTQASSYVKNSAVRTGQSWWMLKRADQAMLSWAEQAMLIVGPVQLQTALNGPGNRC